MVRFCSVRGAAKDGGTSVSAGFDTPSSVCSPHPASSSAPRPSSPTPFPTHSVISPDAKTRMPEALAGGMRRPNSPTTATSWPSPAASLKWGSMPRWAPTPSSPTTGTSATSSWRGEGRFRMGEETVSFRPGRLSVRSGWRPAPVPRFRGTRSRRGLCFYGPEGGEEIG